MKEGPLKPSSLVQTGSAQFVALGLNHSSLPEGWAPNPWMWQHVGVSFEGILL